MGTIHVSPVCKITFVQNGGRIVMRPYGDMNFTHFSRTLLTNPPICAIIKAQKNSDSVCVVAEKLQSNIGDKGIGAYGDRVAVCVF